MQANVSREYVHVILQSLSRFLGDNNVNDAYGRCFNLP